MKAAEKHTLSDFIRLRALQDAYTSKTAEIWHLRMGYSYSPNIACAIYLSAI